MSISYTRRYVADVNIRVAALTCMGAVVTVHAPLLEVSHVLLPAFRQEDGAECGSLVSFSCSARMLNVAYVVAGCEIYS